MKAFFQEKQKFTQWWLWVLLIAATLIPLWGGYQQLFQDQPFGNNPLSDTGMIGFLVFMVLFMLFFWMMELRTEIDKEAIKVQFFPFVNRTIYWKDIQSAEVLNYGFVGGWGIRIWTKYGTVYNTRGNIGLARELKNGKRLCIGTQQEIELRRVIATIKQEQHRSNW